MRDKPKQTNYPLAILLLFILLIIASSWLLFPALQPPIVEAQQMLSLQDQGIEVDGCVTSKEAYEGIRRLPELIYQFQADGNAFTGEVEVSDEIFQQYQVGDCFEVVYLPDDPIVNAVGSQVETFDLMNYMSDFLWLIPTAIVTVSLMIGLGVASFFGARKRRAVT